MTLKNGFRWKRYRVYFENGADIGSLDRAQLAYADAVAVADLNADGSA